MKLSTALVLFSLLSSALVSAITEPNCTVKHGEIMHASVHVLFIEPARLTVDYYAFSRHWY